MGTMSGWVVESYNPGNEFDQTPVWTLQTGENSVVQSTNCSPSVFYGGFLVQGKKITATVRVSTDSDDDYVGFVLGWNPGDADSGSADYLLIDWKRVTQDVVAEIGLAISRVQGDVETSTSDLWAHWGKVTELARATTRGSSAYVQNTTYTFIFDVGPNNVRATVNGTQEFNITGSFKNGRFGCYDYSQPKVTFSFIGYEEGSFAAKNAIMFSCNT